MSVLDVSTLIEFPFIYHVVHELFVGNDQGVSRDRGRKILALHHPDVSTGLVQVLGGALGEERADVLAEDGELVAEATAE